jgi:hypothetical protein
MAAKKKAAAGLRCITFKKDAEGKKYTGGKVAKHKACFRTKGTANTKTTYKHEPKTAHKGNKQGLFKACFTLSKKPTTKAARMLAPACAAIGKPIKG